MSDQSTIANVMEQAASRYVSISYAVALPHEPYILRGALIKLLFFAVTLAVLPLSSYFISLRYMWGGVFLLHISLEHNLLLPFLAGNHNYAAITAICAAHLVLVAYIVTSILEGGKSLAEAEGKKLTESKKHR